MITYSLFKKIEKYAKAHSESSRENYLQRNTNTSNIFENCLRGKLAEYSCYFSMYRAGYILQSEPDLKIYEPSEKSYDADLVCIGKHKEIYDAPRLIHVKAIGVKTFAKFGASFLVEKNDPLVFNPQPNNFISVMLQEDLINYRFYKWLDAQKIQWGLPKNNNLTSKLAWYE